MFPSINDHSLEKVVIALYLIAASYFCFEVTLSAYYLTNINYSLLTYVGGFLSALIPLTIFIFYLFTVKCMFVVYEIEYTFFTSLKNIALSYIPVFCTHFITLVLLNYLSDNSYNEEFMFTDDEFLGVRIEDMLMAFEYCWVLYYLIFIYRVKRSHALKWSEALVICLLPTLIITAFNFLWTFFA